MEMQCVEEWLQYDLKVLDKTPSRILVWDKMRMRIWDKLGYWVIFVTCPICKTEKYHGYPCPICDKPRRIEINQVIPYKQPSKEKLEHKPKTKIKPKPEPQSHRQTRRERLLENYVYDEEKKGYIYLMVSDNGYHKIGISIDPERRRKDLERQFPIKLTLAYKIFSNDYRVVERQLHKKYADKRCEYEWFKLDQEDIDWIVKFKDYELDDYHF